jgi:ABC-type transport system involved in multi-copper enzyme maturation permease subunit
MGAIYFFELRYWLRRPVTYIYFVVLFLLSFGFVSSDIVQIGGIAGKVMRNSPFSVVFVSFVISFIGQIITTAVAGTAIIRDFQQKSHELFFTTPMTRFAYLGGRFFGATTIMIGAYVGILLGILIGSYMPWVDKETVGPFVFSGYAAGFLWAIVPNVLFSSALFFAVGTLTRNLFAVYIQGIVLLVGQLIAGTLTRDLQNDWLSALIDPFGVRAFSLTTRYWSIAEKNSMVPSADGYLIANRGLWIGIALVLFIVTYFLFKFNVQGIGARKGKPANTKASKKDTHEAGLSGLKLPESTQTFGTAIQWKQFFGMTAFYARSMVREVPFLAISAIGILNLVSNASEADSIFGTSVWPVTYIMTEQLQGFILYIIIITTLYTGELIWKERDLKLDQTFDAISLPAQVNMFSKMSALFLTQIALVVILAISAMVVQLFKGFTDIEIWLYAAEIGLLIPTLLQLIVISFLIHTVINNKYLGHFMVVVFYVLSIVIPSLGFEHKLFDFGGTPGGTYSDMNGFGPFLTGRFWFQLHWTFVSGFFLVLTHLLWVRGSEDTWKIRLATAQNRLKGTPARLGGLFFILMMGSGSWIVYNTNSVNEFNNSDNQKKLQADYEKNFKSYAGMRHPRIISSTVEADLFPSELRYEFRVKQKAVNKTGLPIDSVFVLEGSAGDYKDYTWNRTLHVLRRDTMGIRVFKVEPPLQPGDTTEISFTVSFAKKGFRNGGEPTAIAENGTFINSSIFPTFGYNTNYELVAEDDRREYNLPEKERVAAIDDSSAWANNYISNNADWIDFEATVSTDEDQIAIAPGYLQKEWSENGRRYFHYKMDVPILDFYSVLSAQYEVKRDTFNNINLEIYYHKAHAYNLDRMMASMKASLDYFGRNFSPYQHKQARILEFPRYASFAQSFPNTIPFSEGIGFIARLSKPDDIDYVYYVTVHEIAHQWWAHQVIGADVQGAAMLSETFSQYSALMVMKAEYGADVMKKFLSYELDRYLQGRSTERKKEMPIMLNEQQDYIYYRKGSLVMYALQDYLGEERVNRVLSTYLNKVRYQYPPYTTTRDFVEELRKETPDSMQYLVEDLFETITLFENKADKAEFVQNADSTWTVTLDVTAKKLRADSLGNETEITFSEWIDVGVFQRSGKTTSDVGRPLYLQKHKVVPGKNTFSITVKERPLKAGIDPYNKLIDRVPRDNTTTVSSR